MRSQLLLPNKNPYKKEMNNSIDVKSKFAKNLSQNKNKRVINNLQLTNKLNQPLE
jgi:hypothetical protein